MIQAVLARRGTANSVVCRAEIEKPTTPEIAKHTTPVIEKPISLFAQGLITSINNGEWEIAGNGDWEMSYPHYSMRLHDHYIHKKNRHHLTSYVSGVVIYGLPVLEKHEQKAVIKALNLKKLEISRIKSEKEKEQENQNKSYFEELARPKNT